MLKAHSPECDCAICEQLNLGAPLYREIAAELACDDPQVLDPIWRARCQARVDAIARLSRALPGVNRHAAA